MKKFLNVLKIFLEKLFLIIGILVVPFGMARAILFLLSLSKTLVIFTVLGISAGLTYFDIKERNK